MRRGGPTLREAYVGVLARWSPDMGRGTTYPRPHRRFLTIGFATAALALVAGGVVWDDADYDADRYATRNGRDRDGITVVTDVRVDEHSGGEGPTTYTTHVRARLRIPDRRSVVVDLHRAGDLGGVYQEEDAVPVVYDTANPRDADFGDRPNRRGDHESVEVRRVVGPCCSPPGSWACSGSAWRSRGSGRADVGTPGAGRARRHDRVPAGPILLATGGAARRARDAQDAPRRGAESRDVDGGWRGTGPPARNVVTDRSARSRSSARSSSSPACWPSPLSCPGADRVLDAGRGNPNWVATTPRAAFFLLGQFALDRVAAGVGGARPRGHAGAARRRGPAPPRSSSTHDGADGAELLRRTVDYGESLGFDADAFVHELVDGIIGDRYPGPDRICGHVEQILREYLADELLEGTPPPGDWDLFAVEGGTAAICYVFDSLATNFLLRPGDRIALDGPGVHAVPRDPAARPVRPRRRSSSTRPPSTTTATPPGSSPTPRSTSSPIPSVKALFVVNPSNPPSVMLAPADARADHRRSCRRPTPT